MHQELVKDRGIISENREVEIRGRILYLIKDPGLIRAQIVGQDIKIDDPDLLMDQVSTDHIAPSQWCMRYSDPENLGRYLLTGLADKEGNRLIEPGELQGKFQTIVAGESFGRGSSREHAQIALKGAGIEFVIAKSDERIFHENCRNYGIFSLQLGSRVSDKLLSLRPLTLGELIASEDKLSQEIVKSGGLMAYTKKRLEAGIRVPLVDTSIRQMTIAEKIIAKNTRVSGIGDDGVWAVKPGDSVVVRADKKYAYELQTIVSQQALQDSFHEIPHIDPKNIWLFEDHLALMPPDAPVTTRHRDFQRGFAEKYGIAEYRAGRDGVEGICHTVMLEKHVLPGELILGNDSHTCHLGVANALAVGKGASEFAAALLTGDVPIKVPETIRINLKGELREGISTTDAMLSIISRAEFRANIASGKVLQFGGEALDEISVDDQATFTNMSIEGQAFTGVVEPNEQLVDYMMTRHGLDRAEVLKMLVYPDDRAEYFDEIEINLDTVKRMAALPGDTQKGVELEQVKGTKIDYFYVGSCKGSTLGALREIASIMDGRSVAEGVIFEVQAGSRQIDEVAEAEGIWEILKRAGVKKIQRGCGPCMGATADANDREEVVLSDTDRNFEGRMGRKRKVYLVGPAVVAASATCGYICAPEDLPPIDMTAVS